jgi:starch synthase
MTSKNLPHIVMLSSEAYPYAKVGGLGDVLGSLPKKLEILGAEVTLVLPAYKSIHQNRYGIHPYDPLPALDVRMGPGMTRAEIYTATMPGSNIRVFFIGNRDYFLRDGIYDDPHTHEAYLDNMERYVFFMKACLGLLPRIQKQVDIIHCHDWQTGLIPGIIKTALRHDPFYSRIGTIITIHNLAYQGIFPKEALYWADIDYSHFSAASPFEYWGQVNFLKAAIEFSDCVSTVSENYAKEIQSGPTYGCGLEGVLQRNKDKLQGIVNGIDFDIWNPETDPHLPAHFSHHDLSGKRECKRQLLQHLGLPQQSEQIPLIGIISRLADQKGFDLIAGAIGEIFSLELQMVILGIGQKKYHDLLRQIALRYPKRLALKLAFDNDLAHQIEAGGDMILMPSRYEPCGLNQLYSLRYGTVPIVRATGGLADTVVDYKGAGSDGTGFSFTNYSSGELIAAVKRALTVYSNPREWELIIKRGMQQDWSWERSARKYLELYEGICRQKRDHKGTTPKRESGTAPVSSCGGA